MYIEAIVLKETSRAIYLYGHGTVATTTTGVCCICGRILTHPVSIKLGIGPECGGHYWNWKAIGGYTMENIERLKDEILKTIYTDIRIDQWVPKSIAKELEQTNNDLSAPKTHPMLKQEQPKKITRSATLVTYKDSYAKAVKITFPFNPDDVAKIKSLSGRRFHSEGSTKYWTAPVTPETLLLLNKWKFEMDQGLLDLLMYKKEETEEPVITDTEISIPGLKMDLYHYQNIVYNLLNHVREEP
jgi:hypothetical protein